MTTFGEVLPKIGEAYQRITLFGCTDQAQATFRSLVRAVGLAMIDELPVSLTPAEQLADNTLLGPKAEAAFQELCQFLVQRPSDAPTITKPAG